MNHLRIDLITEIIAHECSLRGIPEDALFEVRIISYYTDKAGATLSSVLQGRGVQLLQIDITLAGRKAISFRASREEIRFVDRFYELIRFRTRSALKAVKCEELLNNEQ